LFQDFFAFGCYFFTDAITGENDNSFLHASIQYLMFLSFS
jgi:hypothetical protein